MVERQKPRPKYNSQTNLYQPSSASQLHSGYNVRVRPRSAQFFGKRSRSSPFLNRPQSAELSQFAVGTTGGAAGQLTGGNNCVSYCGRGGEYVADKFGRNVSSLRNYVSLTSRLIAIMPFYLFRISEALSIDILFKSVETVAGRAHQTLLVVSWRCLFT